MTIPSSSGSRRWRRTGEHRAPRIGEWHEDMHGVPLKEYTPSKMFSRWILEECESEPTTRDEWIVSESRRLVAERDQLRTECDVLIEGGNRRSKEIEHLSASFSELRKEYRKLEERCYQLQLEAEKYRPKE